MFAPRNNLRIVIYKTFLISILLDGPKKNVTLPLVRKLTQSSRTRLYYGESLEFTRHFTSRFRNCKPPSEIPANRFAQPSFIPAIASRLLCVFEHLYTSVNCTYRRLLKCSFILVYVRRQRELHELSASKRRN